jgi:hypothetical protein
MPNYSDTVCGTCGHRTNPIRLYVRRVQFTKYGKSAAILRTRITDYICDTCLAKDPEWNTPPRTGPGHTSEAQKRIQERKARNGNA